MNRQECIEGALDCISNTRDTSYGDASDNLTKIASLWSAYLTIDLNPIEVAQMMVLLKVARSIPGPKHIDNYVDQAGYSALACEMAEKL